VVAVVDHGPPALASLCSSATAASRRHPMPRSAHHDARSPRAAHSGHRRPAKKQRVPEAEAAAIVLTPDGKRRLAARAAWLATEQVPRLTGNLDDSDQQGWARQDYRLAVTELARLTSILEQAITTNELPPENPGIVELGDEVVVEFATGDTERFLVVDPAEAPLDDLRISAQSPLARALIGRRVGEHVNVHAPAGLYRCRIITTGRRQTAPPAKGSGSWVIEGGMGHVRPLPAWEDPLRG
jgi:transcription elongation factor GreA